MNKKAIVSTLLAFVCLTSLVTAGTVKIPKDKPVMTVSIPDSWKPEDTDAGITCESPDQVATIFFEVTAAKELETLISDNVDWLTKEQKVKIDGSTKKSQDFKANGMDWTRMSWDADSKEWGPSDVGFMFTAMPGGKILTVTYWITKEGRAKQTEALNKILDSVKRVEG